MPNNNLTYIDLFAGAGGLSEGFIREGFKPIAHVEADLNACASLKTRLAFYYLKSRQFGKYYDYLQGKILRDNLWERLPVELLSSVINTEISEQNIGEIFAQIDLLKGSQKVDLIIGGPPCQAYSVAGRSRDPNRMKNDPRNHLFIRYAEFLKRYKPKFFVFENVPGLRSAEEYLPKILKTFEDEGYSTAWKVLNAEEYGVLQRRRRVIIIGCRGRKKFEFPDVQIAENHWQTKKDLFYDLPYLRPGQSISVASYRKTANKYLSISGIRNGIPFTTQHVARNHEERDLEIYSIAVEKWLNEGKRLNYSELPERLRTHRNTSSFLDRYKVINPFGYSHTLVAHIAKDGHYYIYPDRKQIRSISVREAARIQSFPDDYFFEGSRTSAFKQIGNAVPPLMAQKLGNALKGLF